MKSASWRVFAVLARFGLHKHANLTETRQLNLTETRQLERGSVGCAEVSAVLNRPSRFVHATVDSAGESASWRVFAELARFGLHKHANLTETRQLERGSVGCAEVSSVCLTQRGVRAPAGGK